MGNIHNRMLQASVHDTCQRANKFQETFKILGYMEIIVFKIPPGGAKPYLSRGLIISPVSNNAIFDAKP